MASLQGSFPTISAIRSSFSYTSSSSLTGVSFVRLPECDRRSSGHRRNHRKMASIAMVQQTVPGGASAIYAKEMERLLAKEALLLAFKDAGGFEALVTGKTTDLQRIEVNERITGLESLNPTPRPTTSPFLEGRWNFEWFGSRSPAFSAARIMFERFPSTLAKLSKMDLHLKDGKAKVTAHLKLLNSIETKFVLSPMIAVASGLRIPLSGTFRRLFMISYLDEEILITRDTAGIPEVVTRLDSTSSSSMAQTNIPNFES
ncbi:hypothetical protein V6N13_025113 [Hibiscus sabdariffa]